MGLKDPELRRQYQRQHYQKNAEKIKQRSAEYRLNNKEKVKECRAVTSKKYRIQNEYGISLEEYYACMSTSAYCLLCGTTDNLVYDHDHNTMKFRGVLCSRCNVGIGILGDTEEHLVKALKYLRGEL